MYRIDPIDRFCMTCPTYRMFNWESQQVEFHALHLSNIVLHSFQ